MQNKHHFFLVLGVPTFGEGGQPGWDKIPIFFQTSVLKAPLMFVATGDASAFEEHLVSKSKTIYDRLALFLELPRSALHSAPEF